MWCKHFYVHIYYMQHVKTRILIFHFNFAFNRFYSTALSHNLCFTKMFLEIMFLLSSFCKLFREAGFMYVFTKEFFHIHVY